MSIHAVVHLIEPALDALNLADSAGLQLYSAVTLAELHHPPLNPDVAALLLAAGPPDLSRVKAVLLNQYPGDHSLRIARGTGTGSTAQTLTLDTLDQLAAPAEWTAVYVPPLPQAASFEHFQEIIAHLRAPEGCPWDQKQTHGSLRPYLLEETYEVLDALDSGRVDDLREELGDLLLQIVLHSQIAVDEGEFRMTDILATINEKIVRRHPHVWGNVDVNDENDVKTNWDRLKQQEKNGDRQSRLDGVSKALPALSQAFSYQDRAARVRFDWDTIEPVIAKVHEEIEELLAAESQAEREAEVGDLLFAVVNWARWLDVEPEAALRRTNTRFYRRFHYIEQQAAAQNRAIDDMTLDEMDTLWEAAKATGL